MYTIMYSSVLNVGEKSECYKVIAELRFDFI